MSRRMSVFCTEQHVLIYAALIGAVPALCGAVIAQERAVTRSAVFSK